jgi:hypothetical protein
MAGTSHERLRGTEESLRAGGHWNKKGLAVGVEVRDEGSEREERTWTNDEDA